MCTHGGVRSAVGMKKETKCCEEATSHDIIVFVARPRRACRTRPLISSLGLSNHSPNLRAAGGTAANISAVAATDEVSTDASLFSKRFMDASLHPFMFLKEKFLLKSSALFSMCNDVSCSYSAGFFSSRHPLIFWC